MHEVAAHDVVVVGATGRRFNPEQPVGPFGETALRESTGTVIIARRKLAELELRAIERFEALRDVSVTVDKWFAENTFDGDEFADVEQLVLHKTRQGATISLVLPSLNEAATIGPLIDTLKGALFDRVPLLDEIVLIDSNSTDDTRAIAAARGIPVHIHQEILPHYGSFAGKGEALWKSLYVTRGDIVVWVDTDIHDVHPRFVYGLIGPLLREPRLQFTKGFYRRPIMHGGQLVAAGGGRVTELVARPLFNLFYPELSGFLQPLSGEYAGRRAVLERLPFFTGYGVETGLLIDLLHDIALEAMAQVDLQQRVHRNQELYDLSRMSFAIIQVIMDRLETRHRLHLVDPVNANLKLIQYAEGGGFHLDVHDIRDHERPPIATIPEYAERRAAVGAGSKV
jgi:glucosyl-3-phosphoglycerate synthase